MFVEVAFPISSYTQFTYRIPKKFIDQIHVGIRVKAPLGKRLVTGIVVAKSAESDYLGKHKNIKELIDLQPVMDNKLWKLVQWMSSYYFTPVGQVVKTVLPAKLSTKYTPPTTGLVVYKSFGDNYEQLQKKSTYPGKSITVPVCSRRSDSNCSTQTYGEQSQCSLQNVV